MLSGRLPLYQCISILLGTEVGLSLGHILLDGDSDPQFSANVLRGQTAGWTKMPLGIEVGHGLGDFVFDEDPAPTRKRAQPHTRFLALSIVFMDE